MIKGWECIVYNLYYNHYCFQESVRILELLDTLYELQYETKYQQ